MKKHLALVVLAWLCFGSNAANGQKGKEPVKPHVIFDTDANNELDDQHALAYLLFNGPSFQVEGITVNATYNGGNVDQHLEEARRVLQLCSLDRTVPLLKGADAGFVTIRPAVKQARFDGSEAVQFIIQKAKDPAIPQLVLIAVGKLTNVALALEREPSIAGKIKVVWLGSNYPEPGEYNQDNDTAALNYVLNTTVPFEMVTVRYGKPSGTDAVRVTRQEIEQQMRGKGPRTEQPVTGRHKGTFHTFGDYSINLFEHIEYHGDPPSRALFDMVAVAILKNPSWARSRVIPAPILQQNQWVERPRNGRTITLWESFDRNRIIQDFFQSIEHYHLAGK